MLDIGTAKFDNINGIRTRAIEIVNVFEMDFGWSNDISNQTLKKKISKKL